MFVCRAVCRVWHAERVSVAAGDGDADRGKGRVGGIATWECVGVERI